jgi:hypothetical protein
MKISKILHNLEAIPNLLPVVQNEINTVILKIKSCNTIESAKIYFDTLHRTQEIVSKVVSDSGRQVSPGLRKFIQQARFNDVCFQKKVFEEIKKDQYFI